MNKDDTCFLVDGTRCIYVCKIDNGHVVNIVTDSACDPEYGPYETYDTRIVSEVYPTIPIDSIKAQIEQAERELANIRDEQLKAKQTFHQEIKEYNALLEKLRKRSPIFEKIEDMLDGKMKWVTKTEWFYENNVYILPIEQLLGTEDKSISRNFKLLTLFGNTKGDIQWGVNRWGDGSGSYDNSAVYFFKTEEEAKEKAISIVTEKLNAVNKSAGTYINPYLIESAARFNVPLPSLVAEKWLKQNNEKRNQEINELRKEIQKNRVALQKYGIEE